ncbi:MAG: type II secretion system F family protein [Planctomycetes bacterium]|nr:type II secretion system F family protein [Planctomycetota bacterium]
MAPVPAIIHPLSSLADFLAAANTRMPALLILGTITMGLAVAALAWAGGNHYRRAIDYVEADFRDKLRRLRRTTRRLRTLLVAWSVVVLATFTVFWIVLDMPIIGLSVATLMVCLPWFLLRRMAERRRQQIEDQLADAMVSLSSAIKAGLSLAQAIEILARQTPRPICQEFQQIYGEYQLGKPLERCLDEARQRLRSENFALFAAAMEASRQSGGRLNETVNRIAHSVRELQRLERKVTSETAQARTSAVYMAFAPLFVLAIYYFVIDPENTARLFTTVPGQILLCLALVLDVVAYLWARAILNPDI